MDQSVCPACGTITHTTISNTSEIKSAQGDVEGIAEVESITEQDDSVEGEETLRPASPQLPFGIDHAPISSKQASLPFGLEHAPEHSRE
jgi:hypothetical protein